MPKLDYTVPQNLNRPLCLQTLTRKKLHENFEKPLHIKINIPENTHTHVIDNLHMIGATNSTLTFNLKKHSQLNYVLTMQEDELCQKCPHLQNYMSHETPKLVKNITINLLEEHSKADVSCKCLGNKKANLELKTLQNHIASSTTSSLIIKSVMDNKSKLVCDSTVFVDSNLTDVRAEQINNNLLLGKQAQVITLPRLEVLSKKVMCKHGATITKPNEEHLFYLQSRGLEETQAKQLLVKAFLD
jgi:Fe-S cluster assembly scaffold protein SufB